MQTSGFSAAKAIPSFAKHLNLKEFRCLVLELGSGVKFALVCLSYQIQPLGT
jgi:hypothetical protein